MLAEIKDNAGMIENMTNGTEHTVISLGPGMGIFIPTCLEAAPVRFISAWVSGGLAVLITCIIAYRHMRELSKRPISMLRKHYQQIAVFAPILGITAVCALFNPRCFNLVKMLQVQAEAVVLGAFGDIVFLVLADESSTHYEGTPMKDDPLGVKIISALNEGGRKPHFAVPPFLCCFRTCMRPHFLAPKHLLLARNLVKQYAYLVVISAIGIMWIALSMSLHKLIIYAKILNDVVKVSGFVAIYGLFVMYLATHDLLLHWRITAKFVAIKVVVLLITYQEILVPIALKHLAPASVDCLADPLYPHDDEIQMKHREHWASMYLTAVESLLLSILILKAFPAQEITLKDQEYHMVLLELELERMDLDRKMRKRMKSPVTSSDEDESSDMSLAENEDGL